MLLHDVSFMSAPKPDSEAVLTSYPVHVVAGELLDLSKVPPVCRESLKEGSDYLRLLQGLAYDRYLCAVVISTLENWEELLDSIAAPDLRKNVAAVVAEIRQSLSLDATYAIAVYQGRE